MYNGSKIASVFLAHVNDNYYLCITNNNNSNNNNNNNNNRYEKVFN